MTFIRSKMNSLLFKLLASFLAIIALMLSFNIFSYTFFRNTIQDEIIKNSSSNLGFASENYDKQLALVRKTVLQLYFNDHMSILKSVLKNDRQNVNYEMVSQVQKDIIYMLSNESLYLNNVMLYFPKSNLMIEKEGTVKPERMFEKFYLSDIYSFSFWQTEFAKDYSFKLFPSAVFSEVFSHQKKPIGLLYPIVMKEYGQSEVYMIAFLDARKMTQAFLPPDSQFSLLGTSGESLYRTSESDQTLVPAEMPKQEGYFKKNGNYVFYAKGHDSGLTYVLSMPYAKISSQIKHLNLVLIGLLGVAILISLGASVLFSFRVNRPLKRIVDALKRQKPGLLSTQITEFDYIGEKMSLLLKSNEDARHHLEKNETTLRYYAYINRLKMIRTGTGEPKSPLFADKPFLVIVYDMTFKRWFQDQPTSEMERAVFIYKEYIQLEFKERFPDSQTFQIERNRIVTLIFTEGDAAEALTLLDKMKPTFDLDKAFGYFTIGVSPIFAHSYELISAYEQAAAMTEERMLNDETQILFNVRPSAGRHSLGAAEEQEFYTHLRYGNETELRQLVSRHLAGMSRSRATAAAFQSFARDIVIKAQKTLQAVQAESELPNGDAQRTPWEEIEECLTLEQLDKALTAYVTRVAEAIRRKKEERDPIISFALGYIDEHYAGDLSLDILASKLNITGTYLSTYFKKKQGVNFVDYLNDVRIGKAKELLTGTDLQIQEVAVRTGYLNANSFIRTFKKITGMSPGEYRKNTL
ncbi:helix-turn-helix domain-containing protein [Cohnella soli]|uniref:Helix-turn-helix domain-containing protein n=1 Tax=Cohnella soli TaxID=425005 RepID=A0ABW0HVK2_9BACL